MTKAPSELLTITGGSGFLGSAVLRLLSANAGGFREVRVIRSTDFDLRSPEQAELALRGAEVVLHIAGVTGGIEFTRTHQGTMYYDNIMMNTNVLHAAMLNDVRKVVSVGSVCSYPKHTETPFLERDFWAGYPEEVNAHYGLAKKMLAVQGESYFNQFGLESQVLLLTNMYGPGDHFGIERSHVVPALLTRFYEAIVEGRSEVTLWGTGTPTRDLLYVDDAARALLLAIESDSLSGIVNIGSGVETSILELASLLRDVMDGDFEIAWDTTKPDGQPRRALDTSRAASEIGFNAHISLREGLARTVAWCEQNLWQAKSTKFKPVGS